MAKDKKSFVLYADMIHSIEHLTNEEKGMLFQHLLEYVNDMSPIMDDRLILTAWKPIELQLKRDLCTWSEKKGERSISGRKGNLKRYHLALYTKVVNGELTLEDAEEMSQNVAKREERSLTSQDLAKLAVNDTVTVNVNDIKNKKEVAKAPAPTSPKKKTFKQWTENDFKLELGNFRAEYTNPLLLEFYNYWSEPTASGKLRLTTNKSWDTARRLKAWASRNFNKESVQPKSKYNARR